MAKTFIGPQLRQVRRQAGDSQAEMAKRLGVSAAYVNLLENNQRSLSVNVLLALSDHYGVDVKSLVHEGDTARLADLRAAVKDPVFSGDAPDLPQLRAALDHAPGLVEHFMKLYQNHRSLVDQIKRLSGQSAATSLLDASPETVIHDFFRSHDNHFDKLERSAAQLRQRLGGAADDMYALLKRELRLQHGVSTSLRPVADMPETLREFDESAQEVRLSAALDHPNRVFQLAHVLAMIEARAPLDDLIAESRLDSDAGRARLRVELCNYFAAALLMPYEAFLYAAQKTDYDIDRIGAEFGVSFEQVCQRLTTLQRDGARGVPFFFLRLDRAGNVTKRFNATAFTLAEEGGACPVWDVHGAFQVPGTIVPQFVELPEGGRFFTLSRTADRPVFDRLSKDRRLVTAIGCEVAHAKMIGYARPFDMSQKTLFAPIGINCHVCPRKACTQRAHHPVHVSLPLDANRRGSTRYES